MMRAGFMRGPNDGAIYFQQKEKAPVTQKQEMGDATSTQELDKRVSFANVIQPSSIDSAASDDGCDSDDSDIDDVPQALLLDEVATSSRRRIQNIDLLAFFGGSRYRVLSLLFGPMACFFFIA